MSQPEDSWLLQLPDVCLLTVLRCCAEDPRSLFSAARAHSRLHQAAVLAVSKAQADVNNQQQIDSVLMYLVSHGQQIDTISIVKGQGGQEPILQQLPHQQLQGLTSLQLSGLILQLQPGGAFWGVVGSTAPIKKLQLHSCNLLDGEGGLAAALALLPELQHLSLVDNGNHHTNPSDPYGSLFLFLQSDVLQTSQQLTYLELSGHKLQDPEGLQQLQGLTRLQDVRLVMDSYHTYTAGMFSGLQHLSRLQVSGGLERGVFEAGAVAGNTRLQHLALSDIIIADGVAGIAELLLRIQEMHQLTNLDLHGCLNHQLPEVAAYSALTASSKLQYLNIRYNGIPEGAWQHILPVSGGKLPHLQALGAGRAWHLLGPSAAPAASRVVSCCPNLTELRLQAMPCNAEQLAPLTRLSCLRALGLEPVEPDLAEGLEVVCMLTGLRELEIWAPRSGGTMLLQLAQLKQLTRLLSNLQWAAQWSFTASRWSCTAKPPDEPVWRQLLRHLIQHGDPGVAQQAAAALAE